MKSLKRGAGILLAVSSLPSKYGIGTMGTEAYHFVDMLADLKQTYWQVLPLGPTGLGDSPYQSFSAFAGNPYLIDLEALADDGLLDLSTMSEYSWGNETDRIDYAAIFHNRFKVLRNAFENFNTNDGDFEEFCKDNVFWLHDYALFMAIKEVNQYAKWQDYKDGLKYREEENLENFEAEHERDILFWKFLQYEFFIQWNKLKKYANKRGILIIGEVPLYVSEDSADVWAHRELFMVDEKGFLTEVAGCPPDALSKGGQNWGNPLYNWDGLEDTD
ncbi:MAG: 4-alpha-glucanotransferase, partial [Lachnospiraceae bacterium]|nr:4-alpha-glucanotransferase [Lachnospiraceae bacterium]